MKLTAILATMVLAIAPVTAAEAQTILQGKCVPDHTTGHDVGQIASKFITDFGARKFGNVQAKLTPTGRFFDPSEGELTLSAFLTGAYNEQGEPEKALILSTMTVEDAVALKVQNAGDGDTVIIGMTFDGGCINSIESMVP